MKAKDRSVITLLVLRYLQENTSEENGVSAADILAELSEHGIETDRRTVYQSIDALRRCGWNVACVHRNRAFTYFIQPEFTVGETFLLSQAVADSSLLGEERKKEIMNRFSRFLPRDQRELLIPCLSDVSPIDSRRVLPQIETLLKAIHEGRYVTFLYYDLTPQKEKKYRHKDLPYRRLPVSIMYDNERYYCVFYSPQYKSYGNFRIDKMEDIRLQEEAEELPQFDGNSYRRQNFNMYSGSATAVTCTFTNDMASQVFDTFGTDILIEEAGRDSFTASFRRPVTPTLAGWIFQFCDKVVVRSPQSLIDMLREKAQSIEKTYRHNGKEENN